MGWKQYLEKLPCCCPVDPTDVRQGKELKIIWFQIRRDKVVGATSKLKAYKAYRLIDGIPLEILKADTSLTANIITELLQEIWGEKGFQPIVGTGLIIKLPKKGDVRKCENWRGIRLLSVPSKIQTAITLKCIKTAVHDVMR